MANPQEIESIDLAKGRNPSLDEKAPIEFGRTSHRTKRRLLRQILPSTCGPESVVMPIATPPHKSIVQPCRGAIWLWFGQEPDSRIAKYKIRKFRLFQVFVERLRDVGEPEKPTKRAEAEEVDRRCTRRLNRVAKTTHPRPRGALGGWNESASAPPRPEPNPLPKTQNPPVSVCEHPR